ncbi:hormogonium polysaccharide secretion pseudopilin HpsB [Microcoleus sp. Pol14C6]|uniref:hormogonium polysaccharide secretion pseudopilin HpsB n=1 Tax=unclassified Microcoleus TaxID=2642155 RepID=UPI002FD5A4D9
MTKQKQHQNLSQSPDGGYTIIESLVAMIVVSVLMIAIAPVMAFSVATRVQARRTELATQAAKAYIDGLRSESIKFGGTIKGFPARYTTTNQEDLANAPVPGNKDNLYCVDMDGTGLCETSSTKDFYVQGAWLNKDTSITNDDPTLKGYQLLVRVYRADSFDGTVTLNPTPKTAKKQSVVGSGLGDRTMPVVEMSTEIPATGNPSYKSISDRLKKL